jgi:hypothetical protein
LAPGSVLIAVAALRFLYKISLVDIDNGRVQFHWKDYRDNRESKVMDLEADEFIRRFLLHVLPEGFQRIRYYGFLANRDRRKKLALCRQLLGMQTLSQTTSARIYREHYQELTGRSFREITVVDRVISRRIEEGSLAHYSDLSEAKSIEKRYFTSDLSSLS